MKDDLLTWNSDVTVAFRLISCTVDMVFARKITLAATPLHLLSAGNIQCRQFLTRDHRSCYVEGVEDEQGDRES